MTRDGYRRRVHRAALLASLLIVAAACSGADDPAPPASTSFTPSTTVDSVVADQTGPTGSDGAGSDGAISGGVDESAADESAVDAGPAPDLADAEVTMTVRSDVADATLAVSLAESAEPFGSFASCAGLRTNVGAYSVLVSVPEGEVRSMSLLTDDLVDGPGIHDSQLRVESAAGDAWVGAGTVTLADDLMSGAFVAFTPEGAPIEGEFECTGADGPIPLESGPADGVLDTVEVVALLRVDHAERVLGLAVDARSVPTAVCPGASGGDGGAVIVRVDGDESVGAMTAFELTGGSRPTVRLQAGDATYEFETAEIDVDDDATSGSFSATSPSGVVIDGAFRCT